MKYFFGAMLMMLISSVAWADPRDDVKVGQVEVMKTQKPRSVVYSLKVDVTNTGPEGDIYIDVAGKNLSGFEIKRGVLTGAFNENETRTLTTTYTIVNPDQNIDSWEFIGVEKILKK